MANAARFHHYPVPTATDVTYQRPKPGPNPVVKGLPLYYGASLVSSSSFVSNYLWKNAGFDRLRSLPELSKFSSRFDPTVTPVAHPSDTDTQEAVPVDTSRHVKGPFYSVLDFHNAYIAGTTTPTAVVEALLPLIRRDVKSRSKHSTAFIDTKIEIVRKAAEASTLRYKAGKPLGILDGVPVAVKDEVELTGYKKTLGTTRDFTNKDDATSWCVTKWLEQGAVIVGKTNMHEVGMDTTNNNPNHGTPLNPYNDNYYTGGSSGGSGYCVGIGLLPFAHGVDGGGSVRLPSNYCGTFGLKPSHNRVSAHPTKTSTVGVSGPLAANMVDLEIAYRTMAAPDPSEPLNAQFPPPNPPRTPRSNKTLGVFRAWVAHADPPVRAAFDAALAFYTRTLGYTTVDISIPFVHEGQAAHAMTILAECAAGYPDTSFLTAPNKVLLAVGSNTPSPDFVRAQKLRNLLMQHLAALFAAHPGLVIATPTTPNAGWRIGKGDLAYGISDGDRTTRNMMYVYLANFTGVPSLTWPMGYAETGVEGEGRVPMGMMGMAEWGDEDGLIAWGYDAEVYLREGLEGGRRRPEGWVDVLNLETKAVEE